MEPCNQFRLADGWSSGPCLELGVEFPAPFILVQRAGLKNRQWSAACPGLRIPASAWRSRPRSRLSPRDRGPSHQYHGDQRVSSFTDRGYPWPLCEKLWARSVIRTTDCVVRYLGFNWVTGAGPIVRQGGSKWQLKRATSCRVPPNVWERTTRYSKHPKNLLSWELERCPSAERMTD